MAERLQRSQKNSIPVAKAVTGQNNTKADLKGGEFAAGKTSYLELDDIHRGYLSQGKVLLCDTLPKLSPQIVVVTIL